MRLNTCSRISRKRQPAVHRSGSLAQLVEGVILLGLVEDLAIDVIDDADPNFPPSTACGDGLILAHRVREASRTSCGRSSCPRNPMGCSRHGGQDVGAEVLVGIHLRRLAGPSVVAATTS